MVFSSQQPIIVARVPCEKVTGWSIALNANKLVMKDISEGPIPSGFAAWVKSRIILRMRESENSPGAGVRVCVAIEFGRSTEL